MRLRLLGSAAGGGLPQWNCACPNCAGVRKGDPDVRPRSQIAAAASDEDGSWLLLGASPDVRMQIESFAELWPRGPRDTPIAGVVLTSGDLDACLGLLSMREAQPLHVWATDAVRAGLERNAMMRTLHRFEGHTTWHRLVPGRPARLAAGLSADVVAVPGKVPKHLEGIVAPSPEDNVGLVLRGRSERRVAWFPSVGGPTEELMANLVPADAVFFDGTFWSSDELVTRGLGTARAEDMAHWPVGGPEGSLRVLARLRARVRVLVHVNNSNPALRESSDERATLARAGVEVGYDGMEHRL